MEIKEKWGKGTTAVGQSQTYHPRKEVSEEQISSSFNQSIDLEMVRQRMAAYRIRVFWKDASSVKQERRQ
jgi:hypothetical protein